MRTAGHGAYECELQKRSEMEEKIWENMGGATQKEVQPVKKVNWFIRIIQNIIGGGFLSGQTVIKNIPFLGYLTVLGLIYISNTYYAEKNFRRIEKTNNELKELNFQYVTAKSALMYYSRQTEISKRVKPAGIKQTTIPPYKIFYNKDSLFRKNSGGTEP